MASRKEALITQIEHEALDGNASLAGALRKCVVLGGKSGSEQLRDWATRELQGYYGQDELPPYRVVPAQIAIDGTTMNAIIKGQPIALSQLPDFVQGKIREEVELRGGVGEIEALVHRAEVEGEVIKLSLPMGADLARLMNADLRGQQIMSIYWSLAPAAVRGVLDQIRTALTLLVAELRANMPAGDGLPSAAAANHAVQVVVTGRRNQINMNTALTEGAGSSAAVTVPAPQDADPRFWTRSRRIGAFVVGAATVVGAIAAVIAVT